MFVLAKAGRGSAYLSPAGTQMKVLRTINHMNLEFAGEAQSRNTVVGVGRVLYSYEAGESRPGGDRNRGELQEPRPGNTAGIKGAGDQQEHRKVKL